MRNKRLVLTLVVGAMITAAVFGRNYDLDERENISLSGVDEVVFKLNGISCSLCVRSMDLLNDLRGDGPGRDMILSLSGNITSNRDKAVPSLIVDEGGRTVTVQLYPDRQSFFALSRSGTAHFEAVLPSSFDGVVTVSGSSEDISVSNFAQVEMDLQSSSGDLDVENVQGRLLTMKVSSGDFHGNDINSESSLTIDSSSGDIDLGSVSAPKMMIEASSGEISVEQLSGAYIEMESSSGEIDIERIEAGDVQIEVSSGDVQLGTVITDNINIKLSSGDLEIDVLDSEKTEIDTSGETHILSGRGEINLEGSSGEVDLTLSEIDAPVSLDISSGDITVTLPKGTSFDTNLDTSSGRIRSEFPVMGDLVADGDELKGTVNGGGAELTVKTSSGDIKLLAR